MLDNLFAININQLHRSEKITFKENISEKCGALENHFLYYLTIFNQKLGYIRKSYELEYKISELCSKIIPKY